MGLSQLSLKEKRKYSLEFKMEIIQRILEGKSITSIVAELCVNKGMIHLLKT